MGDWIAEILTKIAPYFIGVSLGGVITGIIVLVAKGFLKGVVTKLLSTFNAKKICDTAVEKGIEKIEKITYEHDITPVVVSQMEIVQEKNKEFYEKKEKRDKQRYETIINLLQCQKDYFDDSLVSQDKKDKYQTELDKAKADNEPISVESTLVINNTNETKTTATSTNNKAKTNIVER